MLQVCQFYRFVIVFIENEQLLFENTFHNFGHQILIVLVTMIFNANNSRQLTAMFKTFLLDHLDHLFKSNRRCKSEPMSHFDSILIIPTVDFVTSTAYFYAFFIIVDIRLRSELIAT